MYRVSYHLLASQQIDCVGNIFRSSPKPHFHGNFWWTSVKHVITLSDLPYESNGKYEGNCIITIYLLLIVYMLIFYILFL